MIFDSIIRSWNEEDFNGVLSSFTDGQKVKVSGLKGSSRAFYLTQLRPRKHFILTFCFWIEVFFRKKVRHSRESFIIPLLILNLIKGSVLTLKLAYSGCRRYGISLKGTQNF
jgi:hypothetical protein